MTEKTTQYDKPILECAWLGAFSMMSSSSPNIKVIGSFVIDIILLIAEPNGIVDNWYLYKSSLTMQCGECKDLYKQYPDNLRESLGEDKFEQWFDHLFSCHHCIDFYFKDKVDKSELAIEDYPCVHLAYYAIHDCYDDHDAYDCPDTLIVEGNNSLGISIKDGGTSFVPINYCPWCGTSLDKKSIPWRRIDVSETENTI